MLLNLRRWVCPIRTFGVLKGAYQQTVRQVIDQHCQPDSLGWGLLLRSGFVYESGGGYRVQGAVTE